MQTGEHILKKGSILIRRQTLDGTVVRWEACPLLSRRLHQEHCASDSSEQAATWLFL